VNAETAPSAVYAGGEQPDQLYALWTRAEGMFWTLTDQIGSVRRVLDARGNEVAALSYDSYGNLVSATGSNPDAAGRFAFAGREWDAEAGLYLNRARYYDPELGRFISEDPLGFDAGEANLYGYARNNPLRYRDPLGTVAAIEYVTQFIDKLEAPCNLAIAVKTLYTQLFVALSLADSSAFGPEALAGLPEALAGLGGFSLENPFEPLEDAAKDKLWEELGLDELMGLLDAAQTAYECGSGLGGGGQ
jgi:RHS repeat-associated protein